MTTPDNIDRFNRIALSTFDKLYEAFPVPIDLDVAKLAMDSLPADATFDDSFASMEPAFYAVRFLADEGFITYKGNPLDGRSVLRAQLTTKGLAVLGSTPDALEHKKAVIDEIRDTIKGGVRQAGKDAVKQVAGLLFSLGVSAVQSTIAG